MTYYLRILCGLPSTTATVGPKLNYTARPVCIVDARNREGGKLHVLYMQA